MSEPDPQQLLRTGMTVAADGASITNDHNSDGGVHFRASSNSFTGTVLNISASTTNTSAYNMIRVRGGVGFTMPSDVDGLTACVQVVADSTEVFAIDGNGFTEISSGGLRVVAGGMTVQDARMIVDSGVEVTAGGMSLTRDDLDVDDGGGVIKSSVGTQPVATVNASSMSFASSLVFVTRVPVPCCSFTSHTVAALSRYVQTSKHSDQDFNLISAASGSETVLTVAGDGQDSYRAAQAAADSPSTRYTRARLSGGNKVDVAAGDVIHKFEWQGCVHVCVYVCVCVLTP